MTWMNAEAPPPVARGPAPGAARRVSPDRRLLWMLVIAPALAPSWLLAVYAVDVPFWDEWVIAELLQRIDNDALTLSALFAQHNEHRMLLPRVVQLAVAVGVGWDTRVMMWLTQGLLVAMLGACITLGRRSLESWEPATLLSLSLVSVVLFSPAQHENFFWGFQICFYLPAACLLAALIVTSTTERTLSSTLAAAALMSTAATFSILPGLFTWPLAAVAVMVRHGYPSKNEVWKWSLWGLSWASVVALYFHRYQIPSQSPPFLSPLAQPATLLASIAACIGSPLTFGDRPVRAAMIIGGVITAVFFWLLRTVWHRRTDAVLWQRASPWILMGSFGLLTGVAIAVGRGGYGYIALLEPRYTALTGWIQIAVIMLAATLRAHCASASRSREWIGICVFIAVLSAISFPDRLTAMKAAHRERLQSRAVYLFADAARNGAPMVPPWLDWRAIKHRLESAQQAGWRRRRPAGARWNDESETRCEFGTVEFVAAVGARVVAGGWAFLPTVRRPADAVLVTTGPARHITALQRPLIGRGDIGERFATDDALVSGWVVDAQTATDGDSLEFWALDAESLQAYRLCRGLR